MLNLLHGQWKHVYFAIFTIISILLKGIMHHRLLGAAALALAACLYSSSVAAAPCGNTGARFKAWLPAFKAEARAQGISQKTLNRALSGVRYDRRVIRLDRGQKSFKLSFKQFYRRRVSNAMIRQARRKLRRHAGLFARIKHRYGVPGSVLVTIWGLETAFGRIQGRMSVFRSLATLAYDCRRSAFFTNELMSALRIVQRGDMSPRAMRGAWAGEIGQTQFLASSYLKYAVDFDGDGRRDLIHSVPDVMASTANYLKRKGWKAGAPWGPGTANYAVLREWNRADVYRRTIAAVAKKLHR